MRNTYFWTTVGFAPPILLGLFCMGVIGLALASLSRWASRSESPAEPEQPRETPETAFLAPDRREARPWVPLMAYDAPSGQWIEKGRLAVQVWPDNPDLARIQALEEWCSEGCVEMGLDLDGGVYLAVSLVGGPEIDLRERNSIREAIDQVRSDSRFFPVLLDDITQRKEI